MHDTESKIKISQVKQGHRLSLNSADALNPSMASMAVRHTPITCQVLTTQHQPDDSWLIESIDHRLYRYPSDRFVTLLTLTADVSDDYKPAPPAMATTFRGVSVA